MAHKLGSQRKVLGAVGGGEGVGVGELEGELQNVTDMADISV